VKANREVSILCKIFQIDEIYVKSYFVSDFVKHVQILHKINMMRCICLKIYMKSYFVNDCVKYH
jgi:hypothetical protein